MDNHRLITLRCTFACMTSRVLFIGLQTLLFWLVLSVVSCGEPASQNQAAQRRLAIAQDEPTSGAITRAFASMLACRQSEKHQCTLDFLPDFMFETRAQRDSILLTMEQMTNRGVRMAFSTPQLTWISPWHELSVGQTCLASFNLSQVIELQGFSRDRADDYEEVVLATYGKEHYKRSEDGLSFSIQSPVTVFTFADCGHRPFCFLNEDYLKSERLQLLFSGEELAPLLDFKLQMQ